MSPIKFFSKVLKRTFRRPVAELIGYTCAAVITLWLGVKVDFMIESDVSEPIAYSTLEELSYAYEKIT